MLLIPLLGSPLLAAALSWLVRPYRRWVGIASASLSVATFVIAILLARRCLDGAAIVLGPMEFLRADSLSAVFALLVAGGACVSTVFGRSYLDRERSDGRLGEDRLRRFHALTNVFIFTMLLAVTAHNVGIMWVAVEATTIATAFLIGLERSEGAIEASWKYILIGSIGIALAFVGTVLGYFDFVARVGPTDGALNWSVLVRVADRLDPDIMRLSFVFVLIGYGTKAGLAPMHTWLPDAHSEAPAPISAMMSGALLPVALYAVLRWKAVTDACVGDGFTDHMLMIIGALSVAVAAALLVRQAHYKRMLAYSSVEHVGLACLGFGFGPAGLPAALLHLLSHAAAKSTVFLLSGEILHRYRTTRVSGVSGLLKTMPLAGGLFLAGILGLLGLPPFGLFLSEFLLIRAGFAAGYPRLTGFVLLMVLLIFISLLGHVSRMLYGSPPEAIHRGDLPAARYVPIALSLAILVILGLVIPGPLASLLRSAVEVVYG